MTPSGMIVTGAHRSRIPEVFRPVIDRAIELSSSLEGDPSLYLYGSVATGTARVGLSDVDLFAVGLDAESARTMGETLSAEFSALCRGIEVAPGQLSGHRGSDDEAYGNRVFLRHYCVHLAGPDRGADLPEFPADRAAARGFNGDIGAHADRWRAKLLDGGDPSSLGRRIARKILLAVCGLVSVHDDTWTTDRLAAAQRWGVIVPRLAGALDILVAWSGGDTSGLSRAEVQDVLDGVVADVVDDFAARIGLWGGAAEGGGGP